MKEKGGWRQPWATLNKKWIPAHSPAVTGKGSNVDSRRLVRPRQTTFMVCSISFAASSTPEQKTGIVVAGMLSVLRALAAAFVAAFGDPAAMSAASSCSIAYAPIPAFSSPLSTPPHDSSQALSIFHKLTVRLAHARVSEAAYVARRKKRIQRGVSGRAKATRLSPILEPKFLLPPAAMTTNCRPFLERR
jgi:hypothetical protein